MKRKVLNDVYDVALLCHQSSSSLVNRILKIQGLPTVEAKSFEWMQSLRCLSVLTESVSGPTGANRYGKEDKFVLEEVLVSLFEQGIQNFVIISYPWHANSHEDATCGAYKIRKLDGGQRKSKVRNTIVRRIIHYVRTQDLKGFWIDRECINQGNKEEKSSAMQSMDRLYALSPRSIGMLSTCVDQQWKMKILRQLIEGVLVEQITSSNIRLASHLRLGKIWKMIRFFVRLASDPWWHRCWIYQEEYCASHNMHLLIPCNSDLKRGTSVFGVLPNELEVRATKFRHELTRFILACLDDQRFDRKQRSFLRRRVLQRIERYRTTFKHGCYQGHTLSSIVMADVQRRGITKPEDLLPIVANCCNYSIRLDPEIIKTRKISLSLALLTQALVNGEVFFNRRGHHPRLKGLLSRFFQRQVLGHIRPPADETSLTFFKHIRFPHVELSPEGISASGYLWRVVGALSLRPDRTARHSGLTAKERTDLSDNRAILQGLAASICPEDQELGICIKQFARDLDHEVLQQKVPGNRHRYMLAMARGVILAIEEGRPVYVGAIDGYASCRAMFVAESKTSPAPRAIFTAWHNVEEEQLRDGREPLTKHVSLEIDIEGLSGRHRQPLLRIQKWINGLCFFDNSASQKATFLWPDAFYI